MRDDDGVSGERGATTKTPLRPQPFRLCVQQRFQLDDALQHVEQPEQEHRDRCQAGGEGNARIEHVANDGTVVVLKADLPLQAGEVIDGTFGALEDGTIPTKFFSLNDDNGNTGSGGALSDTRRSSR